MLVWEVRIAEAIVKANVKVTTEERSYTHICDGGYYLLRSHETWDGRVG